MERAFNSYSNFILLGLVGLFTGAGGLRDVNLRIPVAVPTGSTASLLCLYDLEGEQLYTVKWYKGRQEFFRYVLKELPHTRVFALPGINVDVVASGAEMVVLTDVQKFLSGKYRCEVSSDAPHFHTKVVASGAEMVVLTDVQKFLSGKYRCEVSSDAPHFHTEVVSGIMHVVSELLDEPVIRLEKNSYSAGDTLRANCTSPPSSPAANVTWYLNDEKEKESAVRQHGNGTDTVTTASLTVDLSADSFPGGKLRLRCIADLFSISRTVRELWLDEDRPRLASVLGNKNSAAGGISSVTSLLEMALMAAALHSR